MLRHVTFPLIIASAFLAACASSNANTTDDNAGGAPPNNGTTNKTTLSSLTAVNQMKTYDGLGFSAYTYSYTGFVNGETAATLTSGNFTPGTITYSSNPSVILNAGTYVITPAIGSGFAATSYNAPTVVKTGILTVNKATLTVTPNAQSKTYNNAVFSGFASTVTGYKVNDTSAAITGLGSLAYVGNAITAKRAGTYTITSNVSGLSATNYAIARASNTLTISPSTFGLTSPYSNWQLENGGVLKAGDKTSQTVLTYLATYSSALTKPGAAAFSVTNGTVTNIAAVGTDAKSYRVTVTTSASTAMTAAMTVTSSIKAGWNTTGPASNADSIVVFKKGAQVPHGNYGAISTGYINSSVTAISDLVFTLPIEVDADTVGPEDFTVNGSTITRLVVATDKKSITLDLARGIVNTNSGAMSVLLKANAIEDVYGNLFSQSDNTLSWVYDDVAPSAAMTLVSGAPNNIGSLQQDVTVSITPSETITSVLPSMIDATINGVAIASTITGSSTAGWNVVVKPGVVGTLLIRMKTGVNGLIDRAGNVLVNEPKSIVVSII